MFDKLKEINRRPTVFTPYTAAALWTDEHRAKQMLAMHLNEDVDLSSRNTGFINRSAPWIADHFELGPGKSVCDFGCGPGLYTSRLAKTGADVTGVDFSENSLRYAREQADTAGQNITYINADYLAFEPNEQYDLVTLIMCDFCPLNPTQRQILLDKVHDCLKDGGALLVDVYSMAGYRARSEAAYYEKNQLDHFWCADDYYCFVNTFKYDEDRVVLDKYSVFPKGGGAETIYNWLQYFSPDSLGKELSDAGLTLTQLYKDVAGAPYTEQHSEFAVVAVKQP